LAVFPGDGAIRSLAERSLSVVRWTEYDRGGHFASLQAPDLLVADIRAFCQELEVAAAGPRHRSPMTKTLGSVVSRRSLTGSCAGFGAGDGSRHFRRGEHGA
jgi:hypothetical protein